MIRDYTNEVLRSVIWEEYGLKGEITELKGYTDKNYLFTNTSVNHEVTKYVIKISSSLENISLIQTQNLTFKNIAPLRSQTQCNFPIIIPTLNGKDMIIVEAQDKFNYIRLLTFIEGKQFWQMQDPPICLFHQAGQLAARISILFDDLKQNSTLPNIQKISQNHYFNICTFNNHYQEYYKYLDQSIVQIVDNAKYEFNEILPILSKIPQQILHNDICLSNLLVSQDQNNNSYISGLIDFSSMIFSYRIIELVILCARINIFYPEPLRNIFLIIGSYHKVRNLSKNEREVLFPLIKVRLSFLCLLSCFLSKQKNEPYFNKCKEGHISYLKIISQACSNQQFQKRLQSTLYCL